MKKSPSNSRTIPDFAPPSPKRLRRPSKSFLDKPKPFEFSFPKISSAKLLKIYRRALKVFVVLIFVAAVIVVGLDLQKNINVEQNIELQREKLTKELKFWESFIAKREDYRDAYLQASILEYKLGNISKAKMYVEKGLSLDPNSQDGKKIEEFLNK